MSKGHKKGKKQKSAAEKSWQKERTQQNEKKKYQKLIKQHIQLLDFYKNKLKKL